MPARLTWKDASGAVRVASVSTRDLSALGMFVECDGPLALSRYHLVHVQLEKCSRDRHDLPRQLRESRVLAAVWRIGPLRASTGTPSGYALRFLADPHGIGEVSPVMATVAVAS